MSVDITCLTGLFNVSGFPRPTLTTGGAPVEEYLASASKDAAGNAGLNIFLDREAMIPLQSGGAAVDSLLLHLNLAKLTQNPLRDVGPGGVNRVGLIFADRFAPHPDVLGFMFDLGFQNPEDPVDPDFIPVAREGCAVFLGRIRDIHPTNDGHFQEQVGYTTIHELGHLFNLWHIDSPESFMVRRRDESLLTTYNFAPAHDQFLRYINQPLEQSRFVRPGGSAFDDRGDLVHVPSGGWTNDVVSSGPLTLTISASQGEFFRFEPVELDITVSTTRKTPLSLRNEIDPGYDNFAIWITAPDGMRSRYRPPNRYCDSFARVEISSGKPFHRDVSIFAKSGGYTFTKAGIHSIHATWQLPQDPELPASLRGRTVESNREEVIVKPPSADPDCYSEYREQLSPGAMARLLYYRSGNSIVPPGAGHIRHSLLNRAQQFASANAKRVAAASVRYALGRSCIKAASSLALHVVPSARRHSKTDPHEDAKRLARQLYKVGINELQKAMTHKQMTGHRCRKADAVIRASKTGQKRTADAVK